MAKRHRRNNYKKGGSPSVRHVADLSPASQPAGPPANARDASRQLVMGAAAAAALLAVVGLLLAGGGATVQGGDTLPDGGTPAATTSPKVVPTQGNPNGRWQALELQYGAVRVPASSVSRTATWYASDVDGVWVKFLFIEGSDGVVRAAFDACDVCYPNHRGYRQEGDYLVCNNCGNAFPSTGINVDVRGCNPIYLPFTQDGGYYVVTKSDLNAERDKFA